jgi:hypothetical protein
MLARWENGLVYLPEVVICLVNGICLNDLNAIDNSDTLKITVPEQILAGIARIAADAKKENDVANSFYYGGINDVIMCNMIPPNPTEATTVPPAADKYGSYLQEREARLAVNKGIRQIAANLQIPMADVTAYAGDYVTVHPAKTESDSGWIAQKIAEAYENNSVPIITIPAASDVRRGVLYDDSNGEPNNLTGTYNPAKGWIKNWIKNKK